MLGKWVSYYWLVFYDLIVFYWTWPKDSEPKRRLSARDKRRMMLPSYIDMKIKSKTSRQNNKQLQTFFPITRKLKMCIVFNKNV